MFAYNHLKPAFVLATIMSLCFVNYVKAQTAYYIDGFHGGIYGGYPAWDTRFMVDMLQKYPDWKLNLEIEPETWAWAQKVDPTAFNEFKAIFADQSANGRIEFINPAYAQSYLYNISGESIIRQFGYGIKKIREYFPDAVFTTYSSEEPCFTTALPQILTSFGFKYASLKNPNTCFGGYAAAHGGELINWIGPDGTGIITVPRYAIEKLSDKSTWQTIGWENSPAFINAAYADGIKNPIGMTIQDAGWKGGPFMGNGIRYGIQSKYTTWRNYFENIALNDNKPSWKPTQEDMLVNLVWGSQVTQKIAQEVRIAENKIIVAEKMASLAKIYSGVSYPAIKLDSAWRTLLLSQHHDCWIVPYNDSHGKTWAGKVLLWTTYTDEICDSIITAAASNLMNAKNGGKNDACIRVYNTSGVKHDAITVVDVPENLTGKRLNVVDNNGLVLISQVIGDTVGTGKKIMFKASVPSVGYTSYKLVDGGASGHRSLVKKLPGGEYKIETDLYRIIIDPAKGGVIKSLIAKKLHNKEFVDQTNNRSFNELRGNFYNDGGFKSSEDKPASVDIIWNGPFVAKISIKGSIDNFPFTQLITVAQGQKRIDLQLNIGWNGNPGIGQATPSGTYKWQNPKKAFYDDRFKLLALFPLSLQKQKVYKNAPFDVTESHLDNTFYNSWDSIKNNVILNWVDITDKGGSYGMALFTDHTTSYTHSKDFPLGLDIQYSGMGLWGRDYKIEGSTTINYALLPHTGKWDKSGIVSANNEWNEPLIAGVTDGKHGAAGLTRSFIDIEGTGLELSAMTFDGDDLLVRIFNSAGNDAIKKITFDCKIKNAELVELNGSIKQKLKLQNEAAGKTSVGLAMPRFGFRTIRLQGITTVKY